MTRHEKITDADLLALADGQLDRDPQYKARIEKSISLDPELARRAKMFEWQTEALREAFDPKLSEPVPPRLIAALNEGAGRTIGRLALRAAAMVTLLAGAGGAGWISAQVFMAPDAPLQRWEQAVVGKTQLIPGAAADGNGSQVASLATSQDAGGIREWLAREASFRVRLPDLSPLGFQLIAREEVKLDGVQSLRLDYRDQKGRRFNLFLRPRWKEDGHGIHVMEKDGIAFASWMDGPLTSAIAGRLPRKEAATIAATVREALRESTGGLTASPSGPKPATPGLQAPANPFPTPNARPAFPDGNAAPNNGAAHPAVSNPVPSNGQGPRNTPSKL